jgi:DNA-binding NarL/FixJ family response regulator
VTDDAAIRVLVCDDHQVVAEGVAALLRAQPDLDVLGVAGSMADAVQKTARLHPDVVLMDFLLPDGDGAQATAAIKAADPQVKVVVLTSYADEDALVACIQAGCSGFVTKNKGAVEMSSAVRLAARGEAVVSPEMLARLLPRMGMARRGLGADLTPREHQVLQLLADGESKEAISRRLYVSANTVRNHIQSILTKLGVHSRLEAVAVAAREGLIKRA